MFSDVAKIKSLGDMIEARNSAVEKVVMANKLLSAGRQECDELKQHLWPFNGRLKVNEVDLIKEIDRAFWSHAFNETNFLQLMDSQAKDEFFDRLKKDPPVFCMDIVKGTFMEIFQDREHLFQRGLVNVFLKLSGHFVRNTVSGFKVPKKIVVNRIFDTHKLIGESVLEVSMSGMGVLNDLDRVFRTLNGDKHKQRDLECDLNNAMRTDEDHCFINDLFEIRGFKKGTAHITFLREDLLEKANELIHEFYNGSAIGSERYKKSA